MQFLRIYTVPASGIDYNGDMFDEAWYGIASGMEYADIDGYWL